MAEIPSSDCNRIRHYEKDVFDLTSTGVYVTDDECVGPWTDSGLHSRRICALPVSVELVRRRSESDVC